MPEIASNHGSKSLPIGCATLFASLTKWIFCLLASTCIVNREMIEQGDGNTSALLFGATLYLCICFVPSILEHQIYIQQLIFYRGVDELHQSLLIAFFVPWLVALFVHDVSTVLSMACFFAFICTICVGYAAPFALFCDTIKEACHFESNFKASLE